MRILFIYPSQADDATNRYRCVHLCEALTTAGHTAEHVSAGQDAVRVAHDIVVLHRMPWGGPGSAFAAAARSIGARVIYSADDLIFDLEHARHTGTLFPDDPLRYRHSKREAEANAQTLQNADGALFSTEFLATGRGVVIRNFLGSELLSLSQAARARREAFLKQRQDDRVTLGYLSGSPTHDADLADIALPLAATLERFSHARLLVVGTVALPGPLRRFEQNGRVRRHPYVPWRELPGLIAQVDINLAPLDLTRPFNHAKSEIKFLEAAAVGVPTIAARSAALLETEGALLCGTDQEWSDALASWLSEPTKRQAASEAALAALEQHQASTQSGIESVFTAWMPEKAVHGSVTVTRPRKSKVVGKIFQTEQKFLRRWHYLRRHWRLANEQERHGGGTA
ncbi:glycosyltransferase [Armatimonas sp.]|uniref:glycosyltransferase family protein n=1 Tax=Armatimonas sp. TaxID=1872638 RepID=UPI00286CF2D5|nr:glycosyltransferase [Armatimonas sp.]